MAEDYKFCIEESGSFFYVHYVMKKGNRILHKGNRLFFDDWFDDYSTLIYREDATLWVTVLIKDE